MKLARSVLQSAYILHTRPYRETSLLVECFTSEVGRISAVARGVRQHKSKWRGLIQPFMPLLLSWYGKTELLTLTQIEAEGGAGLFAGDGLLCGLYVNELLLRVLHRDDPHPQLYQAYGMLLKQLTSSQNLQVPLRIFEWRLLQELGYAFSLMHDYKTHLNIYAEQFYRFDLSQGLTAAADTPGIFLGKHLIDFAKGQFEDEDALREIKRLMRMALIPLLGDKPLKSRELFII